MILSQQKAHNRSLVTSAAIVLGIFFLMSFSDDAIAGRDLDEFCMEGPPPPGFIGPDITGLCTLVWTQVTGNFIVSGSHRSFGTSISPAGAQGDDEVWGDETNLLNINPGETSSLHH